jgi:6-phosphogluconolactonase
METMRISRRVFLGTAAASLAASGDRIMFVGTYTGPKSKGIYAWRFRDGKLTELGLAGETTSPSFLAIHPNGKNLYAVGETKSGTITAFSIDPSGAKLTQLNSEPTRGASPCYVSVDKTGRNVLVANYGGGSVAVFPVDPKDGRLREASAFVEHTGSSVHPKRQNKPYAHCIKPSPDNRFVLAADLGMDQVLVYAFDATAGTLKLTNSGKLAPGTGPRHFAFHPNGRMVYVIGELDSTVTAFAWDNGQLYERQKISTLPPDYKESTTTAEIVVHPNGKWLYGSNRGHDSISRFSIDRAGKLTLVDHTPTGGQTPRNFNLDPDGNWLIAANQRSDNIVVFRIEKGSGKLTPTGDSVQAGSPVCIRWL